MHGVRGYSSAVHFCVKGCVRRVVSGRVGGGDKRRVLVSKEPRRLEREGRGTMVMVDFASLVHFAVRSSQERRNDLAVTV